MKLTFTFLFTLLLWQAAHAQSPGVSRVAKEYTPDQIQDMQLRASHKYKGLVLFYEASWWVQENGQLRQPTAQEVDAIDLNALNSLRAQTQRVTTTIADGRTLVLMGRDEFSTLVRNSLSPAEQVEFDAFLARQQALQQNADSKTNPH